MTKMIRQAVRCPRQIGAIAASSRYLAAAIADTTRDELRDKTDRPLLIVEIGAGTGAVTRALLKILPPGTCLIVCEVDRCFEPDLRALIDDRSDVELYIGDCCSLAASLNAGDRHADAVVSSLPYASLPEPLRDRIIRAISGMLERRQGSFVAFQYSKIRFPWFERFFQPIGRRRVWLNIPPAYVWCGRFDDRSAIKTDGGAT